MGVITSFDERRDRLREALDECVKEAKELIVADEWGAEDASDDYKISVYQAVKKARDSV